MAEADPILTEVIRHGLNSAAGQMKRALVRTAFSPIIYEVLDFAVALYDDRVRLLAQAPSLPMFMGRLSFCVEAAVAAVGGPGRARTRATSCSTTTRSGPARTRRTRPSWRPRSLTAS